MYEIHISDLRSFKQCRRKWGWASPLRGNMEPNIPYAPFFSGRAVHHALEMYYGPEHISFDESLPKFFEHERELMEAEGRLWPSELAVVDEQIALVTGIIKHYAVWVKALEGRYSDDNLEFISLETPFSVPLFTPSGRKARKIFLAGRFDGLVRLKDDGSYWIWETKTARSIAELQRSLVNDEQAGAYLWAAQQIFKVPVVGVLYNILRKKTPTSPSLLRDGMLSQNRQIDTTAEHYLMAIKETHPDWDWGLINQYYGDMLSFLISKGNSFFSRTPVYRTRVEIDALAENIYHAAMEMVNEKTPLYPTPSWLNCGFCQFRSACLMMNAGGDVDFLLQSEFRQRGPSVSWRSVEESASGNNVIF